MSFFVHPQGICESATVGEGTTIWAFAHVLPQAVIGADCNLNDGVFVENDVLIGDRVTIKCGVQVWDGVTLEDDVFVGPNVTFTNDPFPRSRHWLDEHPRTLIRRNASLGANCTLLPGLTVGRNAMVGAGAVVTPDVPANAVVVGNPARVVGFVDAEQHQPQVGSTSIARDARGHLQVFEFGELPFVPQRFFSVGDVVGAHVRGQHAHKQCEQFLVRMAGSIRCMVDDGHKRFTVTLREPGDAVYMPAMTWGSQWDYSPGAVLGVFASLPYDKDDYITDYEEFLKAVQD